AGSERWCWRRSGSRSPGTRAAQGSGGFGCRDCRALLGGAVMAAEIFYVHDLEVEALIPALIAAIVGYSIFGSVQGFMPIFGVISQNSSALIILQNFKT